MSTSVMAPAKRLVVRLMPHSAYRVYRKHRVGLQVKTYRSRWIERTYGGERLKILIADPLAEGWYDHDWTLPSEFGPLRELGALRSGALVFDLGAHQGVVALLLASQVGPGGRVVAVEAEPHNANVARENVAANNAANVEVIHAAIAERSGTLSFAEGLNGHVEETRTGNVEVPAVTIDDLASRYGVPRLVYLDIEGYEGRALDGAVATVGSRTTSFFIEVHASELVGSTVEALIARFAGYELHVAPELSDGATGAFTPFEGAPPRDSRFFLLALPPSLS